MSIVLPVHSGAGYLRRAGRWREALDAAWQCLRLHPADTNYAKPLLYAVAPLRPMQWLRERHGFQARYAAKHHVMQGAEGVGLPSADER